jgi:hypothetical protein
VEADKPEFRYVSTLHGDEIVGVKMCMNFIDYLLTNYGTIPRCTNIVDNIELWIMPLANPDGYDKATRTRYNNNGADLNRSFPEGSGASPEPDSNTGREPEVAVIMDWTKAHTFVCGVNFHGGATVVNYPFDNDGLGSVNSPTPYDDMFQYISKQYSMYNTPMYTNPSFPPYGITNGAAWYSIDGGLQDYSYRYHGENHVTIELNNTKEPPASQIPTLWSQNQDSMLSYVETCLIGIRGVVTDGITGAPIAATVGVNGRSHNMYADPDVGDYHIMVLPGTYTVSVTAAGYTPVTLSNVVVTSGAATRRDVQMYGPCYVTYPNGGESLNAGSPVTVTWTGDPTSQYHVQYTENYGATGVVTDGFERTTLGSDYTTGGNLPWLTTATYYHSGARSARAGAITHNQTSWMTRNATGGSVSFWYMVKSETNADYFYFYVDGVEKLKKSGNLAWAQYTTSLTPGNHVLKWQYTKDPSFSASGDSVWIDDLQLTGDATTWTDIVALTPVGAMSTSWTPINAGTTYKVRVRSYKSGAYSAFDESNATFSVVQTATGSCCLADGTCSVTTQGQCSGTWTQGGTCTPNTCPQPDVACCFPNGSCQMSKAAACTQSGGTPGAYGSTCTPNTCPQPDVACCFPDGSCQMNKATTCTQSGGTPGAYGSTCTPNNCPPPACDPADLDGDINGDGHTDGRDIDAFISAIMGTPTHTQVCHGDFNGNDALDVGDMTGLVNALLGL